MAEKQKPLDTWYLLATAVLVALVVAVGWSQWSIRPPESFPPMGDDDELKVEIGLPQFTEVAAARGVNFIYHNGEEADNYAILEAPGGGVALFDYDGDGLVDIFVTGGGTFEGPERKQIKGLPSRLYRNLGNWTFRDVTHEAGLDQPLFYTHGCAVADFNNDGWPDLLVTGWGRLALYQNVSDGKGGRTFVDVSAKAGLPQGLWSTSAAWGDLDGDGFPDLYVCQYVDWSFEKKHPLCPGYGFRGGVPVDVCPPKPFHGLPHKLFKNNGNGTFTDVSQAAGLRQETDNDNKGLGVIMVDVNGDGKPDIYVANDTTDNLLYINQSTPGKILLKESGMASGVARDNRGNANGSMGLGAADYDGSGEPSLLVTTYEGEWPALYRNDEKGRFSNQTEGAGLDRLPKVNVGWGVGFIDLDNRGWEDVIVAQGHAIRHPEVLERDPNAKKSKLRQQPLLLRNQGNGYFQRYTAKGGDYFLQLHRGRGLALADLDNDGRIDVVISNLNEPVALLRNEKSEGHHWLGVELEGKGHRDLVGAKLTLELGSRTLTRFVTGGGSYLSAGDPRRHFGLGSATQVGRLSVAWPGGQVQHWDQLPTDSYHRLVEGEKAPLPPRGADAASPK